MWSGELLEKEVQLGYNIILRGTAKTTAYNAEDKTKEYDIPKKLNNDS